MFFEIERGALVPPFMGMFFREYGGLEICSPLWVCSIRQQDIFGKWGESLHKPILVFLSALQILTVV